MTFVLYAAYGSNLHPVRLAERLPSALLVGCGLLPGYSLSFAKRSVDLSGKCTISAGGNGVHMAVFEITPDDKRRLDEIEGVGRGYAHLDVDVPGFSRCATYIAESTHTDPDARPYDWYRDLVLLGCRYHGFPDEYVLRILDIDADQDQDPVRHAENCRLLSRMSG